MKKRRICVICLPLLLWLIFCGITESGDGLAPEPWPAGSSILVEGTVYRRVTKDTGQSIYLKNISFLSKTEDMDVPSSFINSNLFVYLKQDTSVKIGSRVRVRGSCQYPGEPDNPGGFDAAGYYGAQGIFLILRKGEILESDHHMDPLAEAVADIRERLCAVLDQTLVPEEAGVLKALLLGEKSGLDTEIRNLYQNNGIVHVLAISGLHISVIGMSLYRLLRRCGIGFGGASFCSGAWILFYGFLTEFSVSSQRAILMFLIFLGAQLLGRTYDLPIAMTIAAVVMLWRNPLLADQAGFWLSYASVAGVYASSGWPWKWMRGTALGTSVSAWLMTLPITAYYFYQVPVYGIFLNLLVIPSMSVLMAAGGMGMLAGAVFVPAGVFFSAPVHYLLQATFWMCRKVLLLPGAVLVVGRPALWQMLFFYLLLLGILGISGKSSKSSKDEKRKVKFGLIPATFGIILGVGILFFRADPGWSVTFLNVGQGDGSCIRTGARRAWMVDGGSASVKKLAGNCLEPYLKYYGISQLDGWVVSHFDSDHVSGLLEILEGYQKNLAGRNAAGITIRRILIPDLEGEEEENKKRILELAGICGVPVYALGKGDRITAGEMELEVLSPERGQRYGDSNEGSLVVKISFGDFSALMTGDVQGRAEESLARELQKDITVLKVAHHGSKNSSPSQVLEAAGGRIAVISCGEHNRYGHPHEETLERLSQAGYQVYRTDRDGPVTFRGK